MADATNAGSSEPLDGPDGPPITEAEILDQLEEMGLGGRQIIGAIPDLKEDLNEAAERKLVAEVIGKGIRDVKPGEFEELIKSEALRSAAAGLGVDPTKLTGMGRAVLEGKVRDQTGTSSTAFDQMLETVQKGADPEGWFFEPGSDFIVGTGPGGDADPGSSDEPIQEPEVTEPDPSPVAGAPRLSFDGIDPTLGSPTKEEMDAAWVRADPGTSYPPPSEDGSDDSSGGSRDDGSDEGSSSSDNSSDDDGTGGEDDDGADGEDDDGATDESADPSSGPDAGGDDEGGGETDKGTPNPEVDPVATPAQTEAFFGSPLGRQSARDTERAIEFARSGGVIDPPEGSVQTPPTWYAAPVARHESANVDRALEIAITGGHTDPPQDVGDTGSGGPIVDLVLAGGGYTDPSRDAPSGPVKGSDPLSPEPPDGPETGDEDAPNPAVFSVFDRFDSSALSNSMSAQEDLVADHLADQVQAELDDDSFGP